MSAARLHPNETDRLDSLHSYHVLDGGPDPALDALTRLAAGLCRVPVAAVAMVDHDRTVVIAMDGAPPLSLAREDTMASDVVAAARLLHVHDAARHPRYHAAPHVAGPPRIRGYAAVPLIGRDGLPLGALCVADSRPRRFSRGQLDTLKALAKQVVTVLEERRRDRMAGMLEAWVPEDARDPVRLRLALEAGELIPHYQPIVDVVTGRAHGLEALLRWEHPDLGTLPPACFMPAIEGSALVVPVGRRVLDIAIEQLAELRRTGIDVPGGIAVNVASGQLARPGLARDAFAALTRHGVAPHDLSLEITETTALPDPKLALRELSALREAGVRIVLDDFGVGWSNVSRLLELPVTALKLDRSLVSAVRDDSRAGFIIASTVATAARLGTDVIAEGVEDEYTRRCIAASGCRWAQGWLFSPAVPSITLPRLLRRQPPYLPLTSPAAYPRLPIESLTTA